MARRPRTPVDPLSALAALSRALLGGGERAATVALEALEGVLGIERAALSRVDGDGGVARVVATLGLGARARSVHYARGEGVSGRVLASGRPIVLPRTSKEPLFLGRAFERRSVDESFVAVPVAIGAEVVGVLAATVEAAGDTRRGAGDADSLEQVRRVLEAAATSFALHLHGERLLEEERRKLEATSTTIVAELKGRYALSNVVGTAGAMQEVYAQLARVARTNTTVLVRGESGTGKELIAHAVHYNSDRAERPFVKVSCAALPDTLIEAELFGHEKGAFTGADQRKMGRFEVAEGGTLFLDEIGDVNLSTQIKLLRVLQEREFERLGSTTPIRANVRLVAATNQDLERAIAERTFREDLYYRLNVFSIFVPPLRERKSDVMLLADHFLLKYAREHRKKIKRISTAAIDMLTAYHWPGNVRELENVIERAVLVADGQVIHGHDLPPTLQTAEASDTVPNRSLEAAVEQLERDMIQDALKTTRGNRAKAARLLDTTERVIGYKVGKLGIDAERFKR